MSDIDNLKIEIEASAKKANNEIDNLINKVGKLSSTMGQLDTKGLQKFSSGMKMLSDSMNGMKNVNASVFTKTAKGVKKFEEINGQKLSSISSALDPLAKSIQTMSALNFDAKSLSSFINSLSQLSNSNVSSLKNVDFTTLGNSIKQLSNSLSGAQNVSKNTISLVKAVSELGATGGVIGQVSSSLPQLGNELKSFISNMQGVGAINDDVIKFTSALGQLASAGTKAKTTASNLAYLGTELKKLFVTLSTAPSVSSGIIQMTQALANLNSNSVKVGSSSKGMANGLNLFSTSAGRASKQAFSLAAAFGKFYANWFLVIRLFQSIGKAMDISSGLTEVQNVIDVTFGQYKNLIEELASTSMYKFGMSELTSKTIASRFQAMGSAVGIAKKEMAGMSIELTKLAGDMASFYNVSAEEVARSLQAIFTGETEPLRKYGLDLSQATLKEWALNEGINANIASMTQSEKILLRYQYVMANTSDAQGDFVRTADTWANRMKLLRQQIQAFAAIIGEVFINAFKPALRALNNFMKSVINFTRNVANALGKIFGWTIESSDVGITEDMEESAGYADDLAGGIGTAADNAKKLNKQLQGFDELNVLTTTEPSDGKGSGSGSGIGGGLGSSDAGEIKKQKGLIQYYESEIDNLYELGVSISNTLKEAMASINWNEIFEKARGFGKGLADFLNGLIDPELFRSIARTIANGLNTVVYTLKTFAETFNWEEFGTSIAEGLKEFLRTFDWESAAEALNTFAQGLWDTLKTVLEDEELRTELWESFKEFVSTIDIETVEIIVGAFAIKKILKFTIGGEIGKKIGTKIWKSVVKNFPLALKSLGGIGGLFTTDFATVLGAGSLSEIGLLAGTTIISGIITAIAGWNFGQWLNEKITGEEITMSFGEQMAEIGSSFTDGSWSDAIGMMISDMAKFSFETSLTGQTFLELKEKANETFTNIKTWINEDAPEWLRGLATQISDWWKNHIQPWFTVERWKKLLEGAKQGITAKLAEIFATWQEKFTQWWNEKVAPWFTKEKWSNMLNSIPDAFRSAFKNGANTAIQFINRIICGIELMINNFLSGIVEMANLANKIPGVDLSFSVSEVRLPRIQHFEDGGYPKKASLFWSGENGVPEMLGTVGGRTAVASGEEITGIRDEIRKSSEQEIIMLRQQNSILQGILEKEFGISSDDIYRSVRRSDSEFARRTGNSAFAY